MDCCRYRADQVEAYLFNGFLDVECIETVGQHNHVSVCLFVVVALSCLIGLLLINCGPDFVILSQQAQFSDGGTRLEVGGGEVAALRHFKCVLFLKLLSVLALMQS